MTPIRIVATSMGWLLAGFASTAHAAGGGWEQKCEKPTFLCANIFVANDVVSIDRDPLLEPASVSWLVWTLPEGFVFVPKTDDGVAFKKAQDQFDEPGGIDEDWNPSPDAKKRFRWHVKKWQGPDLEFPYSISFHEQNGLRLGRQFVCDPTIVNTGGKPQSAKVKKKAATAAAVILKCTIKP